MKRSNRILALAAVLVVGSAATFALTQYEAKQEEIHNTDAVILAIAPDTVQSLAWSYTDNSGLSFHLSDDQWFYDGDDAFPVSTDKINRILSHFEEFGASFIIENVEDFNQYGLDKPECVISLTTDEQEYTIQLGSFSKMDEQRYVDLGDGNVYLISNDPIDFLETALSGMIQHDDTPVFEQVIDLTFTGSENYTIVKTENSPDARSAEDIYFAQLNGASYPLDTDLVTDYLNAITNLSLQDYVSYHATEAELAEYGLDEPTLDISVCYQYIGDNDQEIYDSCVLHISQNPEELAARKAAEEHGDSLPDVTSYVRVGDSQIIYSISELDYETLSGASYDDLRHRQVFWTEFDAVTQIDITLENTTHTLIATPDPDDEEKQIWNYGEEELDLSTFQTALLGLTADSFEIDDASFAKEEIGLILYLNHDDFSQVTIQLYRYDGNDCLAVVDGQAVSLVERSDVVELIEAVQSIVLSI